MASAGKNVLLIVLLCSSESLFAQNDSVFNGEKLFSFKLYNVELSKNIHLPIAAGDKRFSLFIFLSPE